MAESKEKIGLIGVIGDEDTVTGFLLAGIGSRDKKGTNFFIVYPQKTTQDQILKAFKDLTTRGSISILLINQVIANEIRFAINEYRQTIPTILEIPSKDSPYDEKKDTIIQRVEKLLGRD